jgi:hypothetical protein
MICLDMTGNGAEALRSGENVCFKPRLYTISVDNESQHGPNIADLALLPGNVWSI